MPGGQKGLAVRKRSGKPVDEVTRSPQVRADSGSPLKARADREAPIACRVTAGLCLVDPATVVGDARQFHDALRHLIHHVLDGGSIFD